ncbi:MAG: hypothetical protein BV458_14345, partial [Thermoplasmata archaeon M9B2D]
KELKRGEIPTVEHVQDVVEKVLIEDGHAKTAKAYILYRKQHQDMREIGGLLKDIDVVDDYLSMLDWKVSENSNMAYSLQGLNVYATESIISHYWLNKIYPPEIGEAHTKGEYHIHDLGTLGAYTYFGKESIIVKNRDTLLLTSFQKLYETLEDEEILLSKTDDAYAKYPIGLEVLDVNGWTPIQRVVKKAKRKSMRFLKNESGRSVIVTEDHPMVMGTELFKKAREVRKDDDKLFTADLKNLLKNEQLFFKEHLFIAQELYDKGLRDFWIEGMPLEEYETYSHDMKINGIVSTSNNADALPNKIPLTKNLGYFIGFYLAEGWMEPHRICIKQKDSNENQEIIHRITQAANELGCRVYTKKDEGYITARIANSTLVEYLFKFIFNAEGISKEKCLPFEILTYNIQFIEGLIAGILDGDGSLTTSKTTLSIRTSSRTMLEQLAIVWCRYNTDIPRKTNHSAIPTFRCRFQDNV